MMRELAFLLAAVFAVGISILAQEVKGGTLEVGDYSNAAESCNGSLKR